ncbi:MAG: hypothetical protein KIS79_10035 [Burkholderiales bacterium]|nr:hypothetical protein [Burkholderiales bacterium]
MRPTFILLCITAACSACSPVIPDKSIELTANQSVSYASALGLAAVAAAAYYVVDPLAPNWEVVETQVADNRWRLALRRKNFTTGGDGEAIMLLHRHAERLAETQGYRSYQILQWQEGVQSDMPFAHRWARGEVELREYLPPLPEDDLVAGEPS